MGNKNVHAFIEDTITATSKGTFTLPIKMRKELGLTKPGESLSIRFNLITKEAIISKPLPLTELQSMTKKHIKNGKKALLSVDEFYQKRLGRKR